MSQRKNHEFIVFYCLFFYNNLPDNEDDFKDYIKQHILIVGLSPRQMDFLFHSAFTKSDVDYRYIKYMIDEGMNTRGYSTCLTRVYRSQSQSSLSVSFREMMSYMIVRRAYDPFDTQDPLIDEVIRSRDWDTFVLIFSSVPCPVVWRAYHALSPYFHTIIRTSRDARVVRLIDDIEKCRLMCHLVHTDRSDKTHVLSPDIIRHILTFMRPSFS